MINYLMDETIITLTVYAEKHDFRMEVETVSGNDRVYPVSVNWYELVRKHGVRFISPVNGVECYEWNVREGR